MEKSSYKTMAVEDYFGVRFCDLDEESYLFRIMMRIQVDYENGRYDIEYYANQYGY